MTALPTIPHWIEGAEVVADDARTAPVFDPALGREIRRAALARETEVDRAVETAHTAYLTWRNVSLAKRTAILFRFRELLNERKGELAEIITEEHGKVIDDALGEIARGQEVVEYACGITSHLRGHFSEQVSTGYDIHSVRQPIGVAAIISPFNFPAMVPMWFFPIAIAAGNSVVVKPSEKNPSAAIWIAKLWKEAGLPDGVYTVVNGDKVAVDALLTHDKVASVSFVGSTPIAQYVYETGTKHGKRVQALGGAKNHMLVLPDADLDLVADSAINAGFGSAGERCMAISVVVAVEPVADALIDKIVERMQQLKVGDGRRGTDMGPLVTEGDEAGFWLGPTLLDRVPTTSRAYTEEIFGPVLSVVRVQSFDEGLDLINNGAFGNGTAVFTNDGGAARRFQNEVQVGMIGVNVPIPVPIAAYSFGGWKQSIFGDTKAHGDEGVKFFTAQKAITTRWLDPSHGGINLGFPQND